MVKQQSKRSLFPAQPLELHLQASTHELECCTRLAAKIIAEKGLLGVKYNQLHKG